MDCEQSLELLSGLHDGELDETTAFVVRKHLDDCPPCAGIFDDLSLIVITASEIREPNGSFPFPDENALWQRITLVRGSAH